MRKASWISLTAAAALALSACATPAHATFPDSVVQALQTELERNARELKMPEYPTPYFVAYQLKELTTVSLSARQGAVNGDSSDRKRLLRVEVRVGDYELDNSEDTEGQSYDELIGYQPPSVAPLDDDEHAMRHALWLITDRRYKEALSAYHRVKGKRVYSMADGEEPKASFTREPPVRHLGTPAPLSLDATRWARELRRASARLGAHAALFDSSVSLDARQEDTLLVNTEGSLVRTHQTIYGLHLSAYTRADDGMLLDHSIDLYGRSEGSLPTGAALDAEVDRLAEALLALREAPVLEPYTGPAILEPQAAGVIFHEAVGHRLEADRQDDDEDGRTFSDQLGKRVLTELVSVADDPSLREVAGVELNGHYTHDDEGVPGQRVQLIEDGVLRGFLLRRKPAEGFTASNGHGRAQGNATPVARMGNLVVSARSAVTRAELERQLIEQARRQGKPFGLVIGDLSGGSTNTSTYGYQAFKGAARMVYRVDAETGERTLVRGVEIVGTPLSSINKIEAASDEIGVFNGYCGAESGYVPVSTVAPALLFREIELQRSAKTSKKPPLLPPPARR